MAKRKRTAKRLATARYRPRPARSASDLPVGLQALCKLCSQCQGSGVVPLRGAGLDDLGLRDSRVMPALPPLASVDPKLALPVLRRAYRRVRSGWVKEFHTLFPAGHKVPETGPVWPLWRALAEGSLGSEHAKRAVRRVIGDPSIAGWEAHPMRTRGDALEALRRAIDLCGAQSPARPRRGGWSVTTNKERSR